MSEDRGIKDKTSYKVSRLKPLLLLPAAAASGIFFFDSVVLSPVTAVIGYIIWKRYKKKGGDKAKALMREQFAVFLDLFSSLLSTGSGVNRALRESVNGLKSIYTVMSDENIYIIPELERLCGRIGMNISPEAGFGEMAERWDIEELRCFAFSFGIMYGRGGSVAELAGDTALAISEQIKTENEIRTMTQGIRLSQLILYIMFPAMLAILRLAVPEYISPLFTGEGRIIMGVMLAGLLLSWLLSEKMAEIKL